MTTRNQTDENKGVWSSNAKAIAAALIVLQFAAAYVIGAYGLLASNQPGILRPIAITALVPVAIFLATYALSRPFRSFVLAQDIERLTMLQHWRVIGFAFIPLYYLNTLPGLFAWPAGLGDVAIGLAAPLMIARLRRDPDYATSSGLATYQYLGLLDFAVAIAAASASSGTFPSLITDGLTSAAMEVWPLNIFPGFFVPFFIILHLTVLFRVRELRRAGTARMTPTMQAA